MRIVGKFKVSGGKYYITGRAEWQPASQAVKDHEFKEGDVICLVTSANRAEMTQARCGYSDRHYVYVAHDK